MATSYTSVELANEFNQPIKDTIDKAITLIINMGYTPVSHCVYSTYNAPNILIVSIIGIKHTENTHVINT